MIMQSQNSEDRFEINPNLAMQHFPQYTLNQNSRSYSNHDKDKKIT